MANKIVFVDTMVLLHYKWLDQWAWRNLLKADSVSVVIAPSVLSQIDKKKYGDSKKNRDPVLDGCFTLILASQLTLSRNHPPPSESAV